MYWILTERELTNEEFEAAMKVLFPNLSFLYYDVNNQESNDWEKIFIRDGKQITYSIVQWSEKIRTKLEVYDFPEADSVQRTQYIGQFLSKRFDTKVVTELNLLDDTYINEYHALLIDGNSLKIIDDVELESDNYQFKIKTDFKGQIQPFDERGCL